MDVDLSLHPFDDDVPRLVEVAVAAEEAGAGGVWVTDHFSGSVVGARWSRDPFVCLGALANATARVRLGPLVLNMRNRHPAQTASAINSLASLAPGRVVLGLGAGASPGSPFAIEHESIGTDLGTPASRRDALVAHIAEVRRLHALATARHISDPLATVTDGRACPPVIVGASAMSTVELAIDHADGLNLRNGPDAARRIDLARGRRGAGFEVSVLVDADVNDAEIAALRSAGVDRIVVGVGAGLRPDGVAELLARLDA